MMRVVSPETPVYPTSTSITNVVNHQNKARSSMRSLLFDDSTIMATTTSVTLATPSLPSPSRVLQDPHYQAAEILLDEHLRWKQGYPTTSSSNNNDTTMFNDNRSNTSSSQEGVGGCCTIMPHAGLRELVGDFGMTLFNPLTLTADEIMLSCQRQRRHYGRSSSSSPPSSSCSSISFNTTNAHNRTPSVRTRIVWDVQDSEEKDNRQGDSNHNNNINNNNHSILIPRSIDSCANLTGDTQASSTTTDLLEEDNFPPAIAPLLLVDVEYESPADLESCPRILTPRMMKQLHDEGLPDSLQQCRWERCFAIGRDGDSYLSLIEKCADFKRTFVVIQTLEGYVLGGFATMPWKKQSGSNACYFGTGQSFLFASHPAGCNNSDDNVEDRDEEKPLHLFRWTGHNDFCQICDYETGRLGMGGGRDFGFLCQDNFWRGRSGASRTFGNPPLVPTAAEESFEIEAFEIYGLRTFGETSMASFSPLERTTSTNSKYSVS